MSKHFKLVLSIRFFGYFVFFLGLAGLIFMLGPLVGAEFNYRKDKILGIKRTVPRIITSRDQQQATGSAAPTSFGNIAPSGDGITPLDTKFGIVIEKINANARVIANVDPGSESQYSQALTQGVAHAKGTNFPGEKGNIYLFSHSTDAPWNIVRFNAIFYLLRELEPGDLVILFYNNKRYDYTVFDKHVVSPLDVLYINNKYETSVLTLQTCDPPGTLLNRLIIRAKLVGS